VNLDFDYAILTRKRKFHASFLVRIRYSTAEIENPTDIRYGQLYLCARWIPLISIIMEMVGQDGYHVDCQAWILYLSLFNGMG
jgi:hypothetical protein